MSPDHLKVNPRSSALEGNPAEASLTFSLVFAAATFHKGLVLHSDPKCFGVAVAPDRVCSRPTHRVRAHLSLFFCPAPDVERSVKTCRTVTPQICRLAGPHVSHTHTHSSLRYMLLMWQATCSVKGLNEFQTLNETRAPSGWSMFGSHDVAQTVAN